MAVNDFEPTEHTYLSMILILPSSHNNMILYGFKLAHQQFHQLVELNKITKPKHSHIQNS